MKKEIAKIKRVLIVFGTRPEAIKMAPVVQEFQKQPQYFETIVCVTSQHREMLDQVLEIFDIKPDYDLNIMKPGQDLTDITNHVLSGMRDILKETQPDLVLVHGDTTTSTATALAAYYQQIPVGHVEAGLRTHNIYSPWPEEMNRQITGRIASVHFAPTSLAKENLLVEGISFDKIVITGNTVIDALQIAIVKLNANPDIIKNTQKELIEAGLTNELLNEWEGNEGNRRMILITGHRRENFGDGFTNICEAIKELAIEFPHVDFVYPVHLNPNVRKPVSEILGLNSKKPLDNVKLISPLKYLPFIYLMQKCVFVLTDSGGIQEEAPGLGKPVLVMRDTTERPEAVEAGTVRLTGTNKHLIVSEARKLLMDSTHYFQMMAAINPYGNGNASKIIVENLISRLL